LEEEERYRQPASIGGIICMSGTQPEIGQLPDFWRRRKDIVNPPLSAGLFVCRALNRRLANCPTFGGGGKISSTRLCRRDNLHVGHSTGDWLTARPLEEEERYRSLVKTSFHLIMGYSPAQPGSLHLPSSQEASSAPLRAVAQIAHHSTVIFSFVKELSSCLISAFYVQLIRTIYSTYVPAG